MGKIADPFGLKKKGANLLTGGEGDDKAPPPKVAPDPDDETARKAKERNAQRGRRTGRTSTVLTSSTLG